MGIKFDNISTNEKASFKESKASIFNKEITLFGNSFSNKNKEQFYGELSVLLNSGVNLKRSLDLISEMQKKQKDKKLLNDLSKEIVEGSSLSQALKNNNNFTPYEYQAIKIGEQTGQLHKIAEDLKEYYSRKNELKRELISSLSYPIIVLFTAFLVVLFMLRFVVPMFVDIFKQNKVELPWLTKKIVGLSNLIGEHGFLGFLVFIGIIILIKWISKKNWFFRFFGNFQLKIPVLGKYINKIYLIRFSQAMALLTYAKIPVVNAIELVKNMIHFYPLQNSLDIIEKEIISGEKMSDSFNRFSFYDKKMIALLKVAEETNQTEYIFQKLYDQYSIEIKHQGKMISNVLNFILTLFVGIIVGVILVAMYLPMFKLSSVIG